MEAAKHLEDNLANLHNEEIWCKVFELEDRIEDEREKVEEAAKKAEQAIKSLAEKQVHLRLMDMTLMYIETSREYRGA